jgi:hypothetical protein
MHQIWNQEYTSIMLLILKQYSDSYSFPKNIAQNFKQKKDTYVFSVIFVLKIKQTFISSSGAFQKWNCISVMV